MPQRLHQQPARIAAGTRANAKRHLRFLHAGFHADDITDIALDARVEVDDEIVRIGCAAINRIEKSLQ